MLALNRRVSNAVKGEDKERCLLEGVECLAKSVQRVHVCCKDPTREVVSYFKQNNLQLLQADKEGGFVVMSSGAYSEQAALAIGKNFRPVKIQENKVKAKATLLCKDLELFKIV